MQSNDTITHPVRDVIASREVFETVIDQRIFALVSVEEVTIDDSDDTRIIYDLQVLRAKAGAFDTIERDSVPDDATLIEHSRLRTFEEAFTRIKGLIESEEGFFESL